DLRQDRAAAGRCLAGAPVVVDVQADAEHAEAEAEAEIEAVVALGARIPRRGRLGVRHFGSRLGVIEFALALCRAALPLRARRISRGDAAPVNAGEPVATRQDASRLRLSDLRMHRIPLDGLCRTPHAQC